MTYPLYLRDKARSMRAERSMALDEIAERLALPRSTVFHWIRDLELPRAVWIDGPSAAARRRGNAAMRAKYAAIRAEAYGEGLRSYSELCLACPTFRDFVALYIAEGSKRDRNVVAIANSDPAIVLLADRWIRRYARNKLSYAVQYHADQDLEELGRYWSGLLGIAPVQIRLQRKSNSNQLARRTWRSVHGVLTVSSADTQLRATLQGWIDCLRGEWQDIDSSGIGV